MFFISESEVNNTSKCPVTSKDRRFRDKQHFQMPGDLNKGGKIEITTPLSVKIEITVPLSVKTEITLSAK